jgi:hypothetical protein
MRREDKQRVEVELSDQVQRAQQILLNASDSCVERARRHFRNVLGVFSDLILNGGASDKTKAARYLRLQQRIHQNHARQKDSVATLEERN